MNEERFREVARELRPDWSDEQYEAHWQDFVKFKKGVIRGKRKHTEKVKQ